VFFPQQLSDAQGFMQRYQVRQTTLLRYSTVLQSGPAFIKHCQLQSGLIFVSRLAALAHTGCGPHACASATCTNIGVY